MDDPTEELGAALGRMLGRLLADPDVRVLIRAVVRIVSDPPEGSSGETSVAETEPTTRSRDEPSAATDQLVPPPVEPSQVPSGPLHESRREPLKPLTLGQSRSGPAKPSYPAVYDEQGESFDLETIVDRCRLKAEGVRWSVERRRRNEAGEDFQARIAPGDREIVDRARTLPNCWIWMNNPQVPASSAIASDPARSATLATAFEIAALSAELLHVVQEEDAGAALLGDALQLAAEAQSALRVLVEQFGYAKDTDQFEIYSYLRHVGERHHIYIKRFMRLDDLADPGRLPDLRHRIEDLSNRVGRERGLSRERKRVLSKLRYHARLIRDGGGSDADRRKVVESVSRLIGYGFPPSSPIIREHLFPILEDVSILDDVPPEFLLVRRELGHFREHQARPSPDSISEDEPPIPEVAEVASLLRGRSMVMICNVVNPDARDALMRSFELTDVDWVVAREHQSIERFKPCVARPDVALVLLPIRWSSHSFGDLREYCEELGKPFVQLPGGYNVNQVAVQILNQASNKLRAVETIARTVPT